MTLAALLLLAAPGVFQGAAPPANPAAKDTATGPRIEVRVTSLEKALPEIGQKLGVPMRAAPAIAHELVLVSFASRDAEAFRDQMAKTFSAEWRQDDNGFWVLNRSTLLRDAEIKANRAKRLATIQRMRDKARKAAAPDSAFDAGAADGLVKDLKKFIAMPRPANDRYDAKYYQKARDLDMRSPSNRVVQRIMDKLPLEALDGSGATMRTVYSTRPTRMQLPMPFDVLPEIRRYVQEQNLWAEAMSASGISEESSGGMYTSLQYRRQRVDLTPAVVTLVIQDRYGMRQVGMRAYDAKGHEILNETESAGGYDSEAAEQIQKNMKEHPRKVKLEFTPESKRFAEVFDQDEQRRKKNGITPADYAPYFDVVARDPLSYGASDFAFAVARGENRNLIARPDDTFFYLTYAAQSPELQAQNGNNEIDATIFDYFLPSVEENGWTRMTPRDPEASARSFYDRLDLARVLSIVAGGGRMTVERQAELALLTPDSPNEKPMYAMIMLVSGNRGWGTDEFLKLYGVLTPAQRKAAMSENGLRFSNLGAPALALLEKLAYQSDEWRLQYNPTEALRETFKDGQDPNQDLYYGGYLREPTFSLPDGLPRNGFIKIVSTTEDKVKTGPVTHKWGNGDGEVMTAEELANNWYQQQNPKRFPWAQEEWSQRNYDAISMVNQQSVNIEIRFDDRISTNSTLTSDLPIEGGPYTLKTLPQSFRDAFAKALKEQEDMYKDQPIPDYGNAYERRTGGGGGTPPPAR